MSRQVGGRGNGGNVARGASFAAAKGAGLIGLAVVIGIILLQVVDDGSEGSVGDSDDTRPATSTPATDDGDGTTTTTSATPQLTPDQLGVLVLNGGAPTGSAKQKSDELKQAGYTNQPVQASDWDDRDQEGSAVLCREGFDREAAALAVAVGGETPTEAFPDPAPPGATDAIHCVVVVGAPA
jgi:hypothetical protein